MCGVYRILQSIRCHQNITVQVSILYTDILTYTDLMLFIIFMADILCKIVIIIYDQKLKTYNQIYLICKSCEGGSYQIKMAK